MNLKTEHVSVAFRPHFVSLQQPQETSVDATCSHQSDLTHTHTQAHCHPYQTLLLLFHLASCLSLSLRSVTMPFGQSGRTLWNVPKLSNRFQVLRATSQAPTTTPLCVWCDRTLCSTVKAPPFLLWKTKGRETKWVPPFVYCLFLLEAPVHSIHFYQNTGAERSLTYGEVPACVPFHNFA